VKGYKLRITVEVKAGSKKDEVVKGDEDRYFVCVKAPRKKGKANASVLKLLKKHFGRQVRIVSGMISTTKIVEIEDESHP
jgi:uncharacterized protein (TIGR00251 family)